jgi:DNA polymerase-3 subunit delta
MGAREPLVYLLHGDDEYAIARFVAGLEAGLGDPATAAMNTTRLDGRTSTLENFQAAAAAMPFLAARRLVILTHPAERLKGSPAAQQKFLAQLDRLPPTTLLALVEDRLLTEKKDREKGKLHWLEAWAEKAGERVQIKQFPRPRGAAMIPWIQEQAKLAGGRFTVNAAQLLASFVGDDTRLAAQEINKLLIYVNFKRQVDEQDVALLTADVGQGNIFAMVDALANRDGKRALGLLERLLQQQDTLSIFGMVVRQFRLLILAREVLDAGGKEADVARLLRADAYKVYNSFVSDKVTLQARRFRMETLEAVYHRLLELDEAWKTGVMDGDLALSTFAAEFTTQ